MASSNNMIYTRVCVDCGKVIHNVGRRTERCRSAALYISG